MGPVITNIVLGIICAGALIVAFMSFKFAQEQKKARKELERRQEKENEIDKETIEQIESLNTGNTDNDFNNGVNVLHNLAEKRK